jgi:hypothetical protein
MHGTKVKITCIIFLKSKDHMKFQTQYKLKYTVTVAYPGIFFQGEWGSTNSVEDRGQRERGSGGGSPLVRGSAQFANE